MSNSYTPTEWIPNRTIATADVFNNMEEGILNAHQKVDELDLQIKDKANKENSLNWINIVEKGCDNTGKEDCTELLQHLIDSYSTVYIPNGTYLIRQLVLKSNTKIIGESREKVTLIANKSDLKSFVTIPNGPAYNIILENLTLNGKDLNDGQNGLYIQSQFDSNNHGGLWRSTFKRIVVENFQGVAFGLISPANTGSLLPIQANLFEFVSGRTNVVKYPNSLPFLIEGQVQQNTFIRCGFTGNDTNKESTKTYVAKMKRNKNGGLIGDTGGTINTFINCYFGQAEIGLFCERTLDTLFINPYFELTKLDVYADTSANIYFDAPYFYGSTLYNKINVLAKNNAFVSISNCSHSFGYHGSKIHISNCPYSTNHQHATTLLSDGMTIEPEFVALNYNSDVTINSLSIKHDKCFILFNPTNATATIKNNSKIITNTGVDLTVSSLKWFVAERLFDDTIRISPLNGVSKDFITV